MRQRPFSPQDRQPGVALPVVIVLVLLSMLLALWAARSALFNEMVVGNDADYQRAFEAAQALLQDAELDIRGEHAQGGACTPRPDQGADPARLSVCRRSASIARLPQEAKDVEPLLADLDQAETRCRDGLCARRIGAQDFWNNASNAQGVTLEQMTAAGVGARYGEFTGAISSRMSHPILASRDAGEGGWYWIEVLPHDPHAGHAGLIANGSVPLALHMLPQVVYRITALAHGLRPGTRVVLQQTYARQRLQN